MFTRRQFLNICYGAGSALFSFKPERADAAIVHPLKLGYAKVHLHEEGNGDIAFISLHEDEQDAVRAARTVISRHGGCLYQVKCQGTRKIRYHDREDTVDPNRVFTDAEMRPGPRAFGKSILELTADNGRHNLIVAVHNNAEGGFGLMHKEVIDNTIYRHGKEDYDHFFYITLPKHYEHLKRQGFNVALQKPAGFKDDGSLSIYMKDRPYINCEAQYGHVDMQVRMLEAVVRIHKSI